MATELHGEKLRCPADDVMTIWTRARVDGELLDPATVASDCLLLLDGGAETTRTVIARTILHLIDHPAEWEKLRAGTDLAVAVEEMIRYVTPIHNMCRVATRDVEHRRRHRAGRATRSSHVRLGQPRPRHFADPERFDLSRRPNNHLAFGFGTHFCLGAALARLEIRFFFEELVRRVDEARN